MSFGYLISYKLENLFKIKYRVLSRKGEYLKRGQVISIKNYDMSEDLFNNEGLGEMSVDELIHVFKRLREEFEVGQIFSRFIYSVHYPTQIWKSPDVAFQETIRDLRSYNSSIFGLRLTKSPNPYYRQFDDLSDTKYQILYHAKLGNLGYVAMLSEGFKRKFGGVFDFVIKTGHWNAIAKMVRLGCISIEVNTIKHQYEPNELNLRYLKYQKSHLIPKFLINQSKGKYAVPSWEDVDESCTSHCLLGLSRELNSPPPERVLELNVWKKHYPYILSRCFDDIQKLEMLLNLSPSSKDIYRALCWNNQYKIKVFQRLYGMLDSKHQEKYMHSYLYSLRGNQPNEEIVNFMILELNHDIHLIRDKFGNSLLKICQALRYQTTYQTTYQTILKFTKDQLQRKKTMFQQVHSEIHYAPPGIYPGILRAGGVDYQNIDWKQHHYT